MKHITLICVYKCCSELSSCFCFTLSHIQTQFNTSATDVIWNNHNKTEKLQVMNTVLHLPQCFKTLFKYNYFNYIITPNNCLDLLIIICLSHIQHIRRLRKRLGKSLINICKWKFNYGIIKLFYHNYFKSRLLQMRQNAYTSGKGLI